MCEQVITLYSKENCPACVLMKGKLIREKTPYKEIMIGRDITREEFMEKFPTVRTVPYVVDNDKGE